MKSKKEKQYESYYGRYVDDTYKIALYCLKNEALAERITEEAFLNVYKKFDENNPQYDFRNLIQEILCLAKRELGKNIQSEEVKRNE